MESRRPTITVISRTGDVLRYADMETVPDQDSFQLVALPWELHPWGAPQFRGLVPISVPFFEESIWLGMSPGSLEVFDPPRTSLSPTSNALYLGRSREKRDGWLLQVLPPHGRTSRHFHRRKRERFIRLAGSVRLGRETYHDEDDLMIEPGAHHHLRAGEEASLMLLVIQWVDPEGENGQNPLCMEDHHYQPDPLWF